METPALVPMGLSSSVYEPAEDSFLLLDALEQELEAFLSSRNAAEDVLFVMEAGCGSGVVSTALAKEFKKRKLLVPCVFGIDVNRDACILTQKNAALNGLDGDYVQPLLLDATTSAMKCFREPFDLIVCNPPYVPVQPGENPEDETAGVLEKSWTGGPDGNDFIIPFLSNVGQILKNNGVLYLLLSSWNNPEWLCEKVAKPNGLQGSLVLKRSAGRERLSVWKFMHDKANQA